MKCRTCGFDIPSGKNYCPGCGRVLSKIEQEQNQPQTQYTQADTAPTYRRPVAADNSGLSENIKAIFTGDTDTPEYHDPHIYKSATAHALEYDKKYVQRSTARQDSYQVNPIREETIPYNEDEVDDMSATMEFRPVNRNYEVETEQDDYDYDEDDAEDNTPKKKFRPGLLFMCIGLAAGLAFIIFCTYGIGSHFGIWGGTETVSEENDDNYIPDEKAPVVNVPPSTANNNETVDYKIGTYTINTAESNALLYKHSSLDQIIATIPNLTVIEITEIAEESGKCKFGDYTGWLDMKLLLYTPNAKLPEETTTQEETTTAESTTAPADETTTQETTTAATYTTGTYTVDLKGDGNVLNVRDSAAITANAVAQITDGTVVTVTQVNGDWGYITTSDGTSGWVYMVYLR